MGCIKTDKTILNFHQTWAQQQSNIKIVSWIFSKLRASFFGSLWEPNKLVFFKLWLHFLPPKSVCESIFHASCSTTIEWLITIFKVVFLPHGNVTVPANFVLCVSSQTSEWLRWASISKCTAEIWWLLYNHRNNVSSAPFDASSITELTQVREIDLFSSWAWHQPSSDKVYLTSNTLSANKKHPLTLKVSHWTLGPYTVWSTSAITFGIYRPSSRNEWPATVN